MPKVSLNKQNQEHWNGNKIMCEECTLNMIKLAGVAGEGAAKRIHQNAQRNVINADSHWFPDVAEHSLGNKAGENVGANHVHNERVSAT